MGSCLSFIRSRAGRRWFVAGGLCLAVPPGALHTAFAQVAAPDAQQIRAQSPAPSSTTAVTLPTIEAIGVSPYRTGDVVAAESSSSNSHIERATLERVSHALAEVLAQESGVQYRQSGGFGSFASVSIRAASGAQTGVYLDGVLLNSGGNPVVDLATLEMLNLSSVDIYRGTTPLQLGHAGIGGAVNLNTLGSSARPERRIRLGIGSLSQAGFQLSDQSAHGRWDSVAALSHRRSDNDFWFSNDNGTPLNSADDRREKRVNADATRTAGLLRVGYRQNEYARTDFTTQVSVRDLGVPEWRNRADNVARYDTEASQIQLSQVLDGLGDWNSRHTLYWHRDAARFRDTLGQVGVGAQDIDNLSHSLGAKTYWEYLADSATVAFSLDIRRERFDSTDRLEDTADFDATRDGALATVHYSWISKADKWSITPALRWQSSERSGTPAENRQLASHASSASHTGLQIGIAYRPGSRVSITANTGSYFREPSFGELYGAIGLVNGNPDLNPEEGINVDVGIQYRHEKTRLDATLFASERDELIVTAFNARGVGQTTNTGAARVVGLELSGAMALNSQVDLRSNLTWQSPRSREPSAGFKDKYLPGEARLAWFTRVQYRVPCAMLWYELDLLSNRYYDQANLLPADDTRQHSMGLDWQNGAWRTTIGVHNLGDDNIEDFNGFAKPGRTWTLSVTRTL